MEKDKLNSIKKLNYFNLYANIGLPFNKIEEKDNYTLALSNKIKDYFYNFVTNINEFYLVKLNGKIIGVTSGVFESEIYGIYGLVINKEYRKKKIEKKVIKKQLEICKDKCLKIVFLQTEEGFYPADMCRKLVLKISVTTIII